MFGKYIVFSFFTHFISTECHRKMDYKREFLAKVLHSSWFVVLFPLEFVPYYFAFVLNHTKHTLVRKDGVKPLLMTDEWSRKFVTRMRVLVCRFSVNMSLR